MRKSRRAEGAENSSSKIIHFAKFVDSFDDDGLKRRYTSAIATTGSSRLIHPEFITALMSLSNDMKYRWVAVIEMTNEPDRLTSDQVRQFLTSESISERVKKEWLSVVGLTQQLTTDKRAEAIDRLTDKFILENTEGLNAKPGESVYSASPYTAFLEIARG